MCSHNADQKMENAFNEMSLTQAVIFPYDVIQNARKDTSEHIRQGDALRVLGDMHRRGKMADGFVFMHVKNPGGSPETTGAYVNLFAGLHGEFKNKMQASWTNIKRHMAALQ